MLVIALALAWQFPPLADIASPTQFGPMLQRAAGEPWAPLLVLGVYIVGGLIAFPVLILIAATAAAFGPWRGLPMRRRARSRARSSPMRSARDRPRCAARGDRPAAQARARRIVRRGVLAIAAIRLVPIAPFTVVNLVAGASEIRLGAFVAGTLLGMAPGLIVMSALGHQIMRIISAPSSADVALLAGAIALWIALAVGVQVAGLADSGATRLERPTRARDDLEHPRRVRAQPALRSRARGRADRPLGPDIVALQEVDSRRDAGGENPFEFCSAGSASTASARSRSPRTTATTGRC